MQNIWDGKAQTTNYDENGNEINQNKAQNERTEAGWRVEESRGKKRNVHILAGWTHNLRPHQALDDH